MGKHSPGPPERRDLSTPALLDRIEKLERENMRLKRSITDKIEWAVDAEAEASRYRKALRAIKRTAAHDSTPALRAIERVADAALPPDAKGEER